MVELQQGSLRLCYNICENPFIFLGSRVRGDQNRCLKPKHDLVLNFLESHPWFVETSCTLPTCILTTGLT